VEAWYLVGRRPNSAPVSRDESGEGTLTDRTDSSAPIAAG
jgi:hypothetical protein